MKPGKKTFISIGIIVLGILILAGSSCNPEQETRNGASSDKKKSSSAGPSNTVLDAAVESICRGEFVQAEQLLAPLSDTQQAQQLLHLIQRYYQIEQHRQEEKAAAYQEQSQKLKTIEERLSGKETIDANDIDETMAAVYQAREYAEDQEKETLLTRPFIQNLLSRMKAMGAEYEQQGKWIDAYAHCYYWLTLLYEDDPALRDKAEELADLAEIELSMKDSSCGETAAQRYEGIQAVMLHRALQLLDANYVNGVDYRAMISKALVRCRRIGIMLAKTQEKTAWTAPAEAIDRWNTGLEVLDKQLAEAPSEPLQMSEMTDFLEDVLALNAVTLKLPDEVIIAHVTEAAFAALDPFTNMVWPWSVQDFEKSMTQQFTGIGVEISKATGVLKVVSLLPDTPAYKSGLDADDEIIAVNGEPTDEMTIFCAVSKITGPKGTKVTLTVRRPSTGQVKDVTITRDKIVVQPLRGWTREADGRWNYFIDPENRIGYVRLTSFTETSGPDLDEVLSKLEKNGLSGLILDLRFNSGGYLQSAAEVVDLFVREGIIVKSSPRYGLDTYEIAHRSGTHPDYPLVILINGSSASASEIVAGALQDPEHRRATLVGQRTYGKGSVQVVTGFTGGGSQLKYTVAYYHLPSNQQVKNRYQMEKLGRKDWGIAPDVTVEMLRNEVQKMLDIQRDNDVLSQTDHPENGAGSRRHQLEETLRADPQLSIGLLVLQSKLIAQGRTLALTQTAADNRPAEPNAVNVP
ncbi:MAG: S41 family peptidase [Phycisphaerae bacterium]|nr:S41 family peptidase [Phycisphaerae bacterium]